MGVKDVMALYTSGASHIPESLCPITDAPPDRGRTGWSHGDDQRGLGLGTTDQYRSLLRRLKWL